MQDFIITLLVCSVNMSALALFCIAVTPLAAKRYSAKGRYYAWLIIVIGLLIPFRPQWDNAIVQIDVPSRTVAPPAVSASIGNDIYFPPLDSVGDFAA